MRSLLESAIASPRSLRVRSLAKRGTQRMPGIAEWAPRIRNTGPRFALDDATTALCADLVCRSGDALGRCLEAVRMPAEDFWLEWSDWERRAVELRCEGLDPSVVPPLGPAGIHVQCDESLRRGTIRSYWSDEPGGTAKISSIITEFDLDHPSHSSEKSSFPSRFDAVNATHGGQIIRHACYFLPPEWRQFYAERDGVAKYRPTVTTLIAGVIFDFPLLVAFCTLLMSRGEAVLERAQKRSGDSTRSVRDRRPSREPTEVTLSLLGMSASDAERAGPAHGGRRRLHFVRGHPVRRGAIIFWRSPHLRGSADLGTVPAKIVRVKLGSTSERKKGSTGPPFSPAPRAIGKSPIGERPCFQHQFA